MSAARLPPPSVKDALAAAWAALVASVILTLGDGLHRHRWGDAGVVLDTLTALHCISAVLVPAVLLGAMACLTLLHARWSSWAKWGVWGFAVTLAFLPTARFMFSGNWVRHHPAASYGPWLVSSAIGAMVGGVLLVVELAMRRQNTGRFALGRLLSATFALLAVGGLYLDQHVYVSLYARLHVALEVAALAVLCLSAVLFARELWARFPTLLVPRSIPRGAQWTLLCVGTIALWGATRPWTSQYSFSRLEADLLHGYKEPVYVGRYLRRLKSSRAFLADPLDWRGTERHALAELQREYDLQAPELDGIWAEQAVVPPAPLCPSCNVVVFYVDTLRRDVALSSRYMPNLARFASGALNFERAYAAGSDTLTSLPALLSGRYASREEAPAEMLDLARDVGMRSVLSIPRSAREFLTKLYPPFAFDDVLETEDYSPENSSVWGYGADRPSGAGGVDQMLEWMRSHQDQRFMSWVFNFELHNWRELSDGHVAAAAVRAGVSQEDKRWRYWALAHETDRQFGRLVDGMRELGVLDNTIVVVVSDHGEALGEWDYWLHGIFLWESLVRVPLLIRAPGVQPRVVSDPVSLTDLLPTFAALLSTLSDAEGEGRRYAYHGMNLLDVLSGQPRRHPVLFVGRLKEDVVRIGLLDPRSDLKLVLPLDSGRPELYDTKVDVPDDADLATESPVQVARLLDTALRSPLFPRHLLARETSSSSFSEVSTSQ